VGKIKLTLFMPSPNAAFDYQESIGNLNEAYTIISAFGTPTTYRIWMRFLYPGGNDGGPNTFSNKHLGVDPDQVLRRRNLQGLEPNESWDVAWRYNARVASDGRPQRPILTNTAVLYGNSADKKIALYCFAKALFEAMMAGRFGDYRTTRQSGYIDGLEVDFGTPRVLSAGQGAGAASKIRIGARRRSTLNQANAVSFDVNHLGGPVS
jgi:hypothetical protein